MARYRPVDQGGCLTACSPSLQLLSEKSSFLCQTVSFPATMAAQNVAPRFRAIAPRPSENSSDSPSPSSSIDNSNANTAVPDETAASAKKQRKRPASSKTANPRAAKRPTGAAARDTAVQEQVAPKFGAKNFLSSLQAMRATSCLPPRSPAEVLREFQVLDGTPLGRLLRAIPDVKVGGATITWGKEGPVLASESGTSSVSSPSSSTPPSPARSCAGRRFADLMPASGAPSMPPLPSFLYSPTAAPPSPCKPVPVGQLAAVAVTLAGPASPAASAALPAFPASFSAKASSPPARTAAVEVERDSLLLKFGTPAATPAGRLPPVTAAAAPSVTFGTLYAQQRAAASGMKPPGSAPGRDSAGPGVVLTAADMEHSYGAPTKPAMLTDEDHRLLWANAAFKRAAGEAVAGGNGCQVATPDVLAFPVPVTSVLFRRAEGAAPCAAVLWAFVRREEPRGPAGSASQRLQQRENLGEVTVAAERTTSAGRAASRSSSLMEGLEAGPAAGGEGSPSSPHSWSRERASPGRSTDSCYKVIHPKAVRSVGSRIQLDDVRQVSPFAVPIRGSYEAVCEEFDSVDRCHTPVVLTDVRGKVRWVNTAYKLLIGQPKCAWLASTTGQGGQLSEPRLMGEVTMMGLEAVSELAQVGAAALRCTAEISWGGGESGKRGKVRVPAIATRLDAVGEHAATLGFVWHFDTEAGGVGAPRAGA